MVNLSYEVFGKEKFRFINYDMKVWEDLAWKITPKSPDFPLCGIDYALVALDKTGFCYYVLIHVSHMVDITECVTELQVLV